MKRLDPNVTPDELAQPERIKSDCDFHSLLGIGLEAPLNPNPQVENEDELWSQMHGDCFAYALAKEENCPLLTLDRDFRNTEIRVVLPKRVS